MRETRIRIIDSLQAFSEVAQPWNELAGDQIFRRWEWMFSWWEAFHFRGELAILVVEDDNGRWLAVAPWYISTHKGRGKMVKMLACDEACSDYSTILVREGFAETSMKALADVIVSKDSASVFHNVSLYDIEGHGQLDVAVAALAEELEQQLVSVETEIFSATWRKDLPESWDELQAGLRASFRRKTRKATKRLLKSEIVANVLTTPNEIDEAWSTFIDLHQRRRISLGEPGCFAKPPFEEFLRNATLRLAEIGLANLNLITNEGKPLSVNLEFISNNDVFMYQSGMDPDRGDLEPGHMMFAFTFQQAINKKRHCFDFLRGDEPYKGRWNARRVPVLRTRIISNRISAKMRHCAWTTGRQLKRWTQCLLNRD